MKLSDAAIRNLIWFICIALTLPLVFVFSPSWLLLLFLPLFGIPAARQLGLLHDEDERQNINALRSSHFALYAIVIYIIVVMLELGMKGETIPSYFTAILILAIGVKLFSYIILNTSPRKAGIIVACTAGAFWLLFTALSHVSEPLTMLMESIIGAPIIIFALLSLKWPRVSGALLILNGLVLCMIPVMGVLRGHQLEVPLLMFITLAFPPLLAGALMLYHWWVNRPEESEEHEPSDDQ